MFMNSYHMLARLTKVSEVACSCGGALWEFLDFEEGVRHLDTISACTGISSESGMRAHVAGRVILQCLDLLFNRGHGACSRW